MQYYAAWRASAWTSFCRYVNPLLFLMFSGFSWRQNERQVILVYVGCVNVWVCVCNNVFFTPSHKLDRHRRFRNHILVTKRGGDFFLIKIFLKFKFLFPFSLFIVNQTMGLCDSGRPSGQVLCWMYSFR